MHVIYEQEQNSKNYKNKDFNSYQLERENREHVNFVEENEEMPEVVNEVSYQKSESEDALMQ